MNLTDLIVSRCVSICRFDYIGTYIHVCVGCNISKLTLNLLEKKPLNQEIEFCMIEGLPNSNHDFVI